MTMTNEEIVRDYTQAANKSKQIKILAELNAVPPSEIRAVLAEAGVEGVQMPKRAANRKPETEASGPAASEPEIYGRIETILAALPEGASGYVQAVAITLVVALLQEHLEQRFGKGGAVWKD